MKYTASASQVALVYPDVISGTFLRIICI